MDCVKVNEKNINWFLPILRSDAQEQLTNDPDTFAIGAVCDGTACGILVYTVSEVPIVPDEEADMEFDGEVDEKLLEMEEDGSLMIEITYLAVSDAYRRRGVATMLVNTLVECAKDPLSAVYSYFPAKDEDDPLYRFFAELPDFSTEERDEHVCRISHDMLAGNGKLREYRRKALNFEEFFSISPFVQKDFKEKIGEDAGYVFENANTVNPLCICVRSNNEVKTAIFIERYGENDLYLSYAYSTVGNEVTLIRLLAEAAGMIVRDYPSSELYIAAVTPSSVSITDKLFPEKEIVNHYYLTGWDID